jgi:hypothetical protein
VHSEKPGNQIFHPLKHANELEDDCNGYVELIPATDAFGFVMVDAL